MATAEAVPMVQADVDFSLLGTSPGSDMCMELVPARCPPPPHRRALRFLLRPLRRPSKAGEQSSDRLAGSSDSEGEVLVLVDAPGHPQRRQPTSAPPAEGVSLRGEGAQARGLLSRALRAALRGMARLATAFSAHLRPRGPGLNDTLLAERVANIITSLPFLAVGLATMRSRKTRAARHFGASFVGVGAAACLYHGCSGRWRPVARKLDYWSICYSTGALRKATHVQLPRTVKVAAALLTPVAPTVVTMFNLVAIEARYTRAVLQHEHLVRAWCWHMGTAVVAVASFLWEDTAIERDWPPVFHAAWHCLSATAVGTATRELLNHLDG